MELDNACFVHNVRYVNSKNLAKRTISDNVLKKGAYGIAPKSQHNGFKKAPVNVVHKYF